MHTYIHTRIRHGTCGDNEPREPSPSVALRAHLPEVDVILSLLRPANANHVASDRWHASKVRCVRTTRRARFGLRTQEAVFTAGPHSV